MLHSDLEQEFQRLSKAKMNLGEYHDDPILGDLQSQPQQQQQQQEQSQPEQQQQQQLRQRRGRGGGPARAQSYGGSGMSGTSYDRWSYEQAARAGAGSNDTPLNKLQHKYWVTKSKVVRKLGKEEDEHVVASDADLDAKLELFRSINETTRDLQFILEQYNDRLCNLAFEENCMGRFLKDFGKMDKTKAGKMMQASGKAISYSSQQRLALRPSILRLAEEVDTFRYRAVEDTHDTVKSMEKVRTEYRGALMWMKNVSSELDPDTYKQLEKFRKVQGHVKFSKQKFDKLKVDCYQKIDLLAAARCNMYSHALVHYQDSLITFCDKVAKTFKHVESSFKGYQPYEFTYIKELAEPSRMMAELDKKNKAAKKAKDQAKKNAADGKEKTSKETKEPENDIKDEKYFFDLDDGSGANANANETEEAIDALELAKQSEASLNNLLDLQDNDDDDLLLAEIGKSKQKQSGPAADKEHQKQEGFDLLSKMDQNESKLLEDLMSDFPSKASEEDSPTRFSTQWNKLFGDKDKEGGQVNQQPTDESLLEDLNLPAITQTGPDNDNDDFTSFFSARSAASKKANSAADDQPKSALLPSQLFDLDQSLFSQQPPRAGPHDLLSDFPMPSPARPTSVQKQIDKLQQEETSGTEDPTLDLMNSLSSMSIGTGPLKDLESLQDLQPGLQNLQQGPMLGSSSMSPPGSGSQALAQASQQQQQQQQQKPSSKAKKSNKDMSQWFSLFADLDPLANPDAIGKSTKEEDPNCYS